jgi:hypothetical protein
MLRSQAILDIEYRDTGLQDMSADRGVHVLCLPRDETPWVHIEDGSGGLSRALFRREVMEDWHLMSIFWPWHKMSPQSNLRFEVRSGGFDGFVDLRYHWVHHASSGCDISYWHWMRCHGL